MTPETRPTAQKGINILSDTVIESIEKTDHGYTVHLQEGESLPTDLVMYATGRKPKTSGIGLEKADIRLNDSGAIIVNEWFQIAFVMFYQDGVHTTITGNSLPIGLLLEIAEEIAAAPPSDVVIPLSVKIPMTDEILAAVEGFSAEQGWRLVGYCFSEGAQGPDNVGRWCYHDPRQVEAEVKIWVGRTSSDFGYTLILEQQPDGSYIVVSPTSSDIEHVGPP